MHTFLTVLLVIVSVLLIVVVMLQPGKADGFNLVSSGAETFLSKNKTKTRESVLSKATVILAVLFLLLTSAISIIK
ncbi:preprotein translocase subunit SecG [Clostridium sediminicola]|uniref:preprotein translocase subunit SecG n=1 Tax=Clostridium sediminicola TaxID=3114879 RepID=UPI0031F1D23C